jgi:hypothetical protein
MWQCGCLAVQRSGWIPDCRTPRQDPEDLELAPRLKYLLDRGHYCGLVDTEGVAAINRNVATGRFKRKHYVDMWEERLGKLEEMGNASAIRFKVLATGVKIVRAPARAAAAGGGSPGAVAAACAALGAGGLHLPERLWQATPAGYRRAVAGAWAAVGGAAKGAAAADERGHGGRADGDLPWPAARARAGGQAAGLDARAAGAQAGQGQD